MPKFYTVTLIAVGCQLDGRPPYFVTMADDRSAHFICPDCDAHYKVVRVKQGVALYRSDIALQGLQPINPLY
jgi:hypothetical protein